MKKNSLSGLVRHQSYFYSATILFEDTAGTIWANETAIRHGVRTIAQKVGYIGFGRELHSTIFTPFMLNVTLKLK